MAIRVITNLFWFNNDDPNDTLIGTQEVQLQGPAPYDETSQGTWVVLYIGPYYTSPGGEAMPPVPLSLLKGPISGISPAIPWWWLATKPGPPSHTVVTPSSGASNPFYY